jgi:hypothetical protein
MPFPRLFSASDSSHVAADLPGLTALASYHVRVRAVGAQGPGAWSPWRGFTTEPTRMQALYYHADPLGSVQAVTNAQGESVG